MLILVDFFKKVEKVERKLFLEENRVQLYLLFLYFRKKKDIFFLPDLAD